MDMVWKFGGYEEITVELLNTLGISMVICDLDFTLAPRWQRIPSDEAMGWINEMLENNILVAIVSNNYSKKRVRRFAEDARLVKSLPYAYLAMKPFAKSVLRILRDLNVDLNEVVMIGNCWTTDMLCAKRVGIKGWKVKSRVR